MTAPGRVLVAREGPDRGQRRIRVVEAATAPSLVVGWLVECVAHPRLPGRVGYRTVVTTDGLRRKWDPVKEDDRG